MTRFCSAAAARRSTSKVAMTVVATPVTTVAGSPALKPSVVVSPHGTPTLARIRSTTCCAVSVERWPRTTPTDKTVMAVPRMTSRLDMSALSTWYLLWRDCNTGGTEDAGQDQHGGTETRGKRRHGGSGAAYAGSFGERSCRAARGVVGRRIAKTNRI